MPVKAARWLATVLIVLFVTIYSLSHIALPLPPHHPIYGDGSAIGRGTGIVLGALAPSGERGMLRLSADYFMRTRYNPFL